MIRFSNKLYCKTSGVYFVLFVFTVSEKFLLLLPETALKSNSYLVQWRITEHSHRSYQNTKTGLCWAVRWWWRWW